MPRIEENGLPGYYGSVGLAESSDDGASWTRRGQILRGARPKEWTAYPGHTARGTGLPGAVADPDGRYVYAYYTDQSMQEGRGTQICMARADLNEGPPLPGRWKKLFRGAFAEPGVGGRESPVVDVLATDGAHAMYPHVSYSRYLGAYVMALNVNAWKEPARGAPPSRSGIYVATSGDAVHWSRPVQLLSDYSYPMPRRSLSWEATVVFDDADGRDGWLVYAHSPDWPAGPRVGKPHFMVGRRIALRRADRDRGARKGDGGALSKTWALVPRRPHPPSPEPHGFRTLNCTFRDFMYVTRPG
jgi:hypothetical protein